jgi:hypothetical protein
MILLWGKGIRPVIRHTLSYWGQNLLETWTSIFTVCGVLLTSSCSFPNGRPNNLSFTRGENNRISLRGSGMGDLSWAKSESNLRLMSSVLGTAGHLMAAAGSLLKDKGDEFDQLKSLLLQVDQSLGISSS